MMEINNSSTVTFLCANAASFTNQEKKKKKLWKLICGFTYKSNERVDLLEDI